MPTKPVVYGEETNKLVFCNIVKLFFILNKNQATLNQTESWLMDSEPYISK